MVVKPPISKTQKRMHMKSVFDEIEIVMEINTSSQSYHGKEPRKMMPSMQRFELSPNDVTELLIREPLLIVRLSILNPVSYTQQETGKRLSRLYL